MKQEFIRSLNADEVLMDLLSSLEYQAGNFYWQFLQISARSVTEYA